MLPKYDITFMSQAYWKQEWDNNGTIVGQEWGKIGTRVEQEWSKRRAKGEKSFQQSNWGKLAEKSNIICGLIKRVVGKSTLD